MPPGVTQPLSPCTVNMHPRGIKAKDHRTEFRECLPQALGTDFSLETGFAGIPREAVMWPRAQRARAHGETAVAGQGANPTVGVNEAVKIVAL